MNKALKLTLLIAALLFVLLGGGIWYATSFIKPAQLAQSVGTSVKEATGRDVHIHGAISLKFFPSLGIVAEEVALSNAPWAKNADMLKIKHLEMDIKLLPLLASRVDFNSIAMNGLDIQLEVNKAGQGNWEFTSPVSTPQNTVSTSAAQNSDQDTVDPLRIKNLTITDASLSYQNFGSPPKKISISKLNIGSSGDSNEIAAQAIYGVSQIAIKGKVSSIRDTVNNWNIKPEKLNLDLVLTVAGKDLAISGQIDKAPNILPKFDLKLSSKSFELVTLAGSAAAVTGNTNVAAASTSSSKYFFSDDALPFDLLPEAAGTLALDIDELSIPGHATLSLVKGEFHFDGQKIGINDLSFGIGKGSAQMQARLEKIHSVNPSVAMKGIAKGFTLEQLMDSVDSNTKVKGGDSQIAINIKSTGSSMHQLAANATGVVQASVGKGSLDSRFIDRGGDLLITVVDAVNPMRKKTDQTILECAVFYLPMTNGQVALNDSIGVVTDRLDIVLSGSVDLKTENLNIKIDPREKSGLTTGVNLAGLVKLQGTLMNPKAGVNKEGVVNSAVSIGLGILTGGATILAENAKSIATKSQPCKAALHPWSDIYSGAQ